MRGEIDFSESLIKRVQLLEGLSTDALDKVKSLITFNPGVKELTRVLKFLGYKMAVVSGGFIPLARFVQKELGLDFAFANTLEVTLDGKHFTG